MAAVVAASVPGPMAVRHRLPAKLYCYHRSRIGCHRSETARVTITLVLPEVLTGQILSSVGLPLETAGVLVATPLEASAGLIKLLGRSLHFVDDRSYLERRADGLSIASTGYVPALAEAERLNAVPIWFHTHPSEAAIPFPSGADGVVNSEIGDVFRLRSGSRFYATLIVSPRGDGFTYTGTLENNGGQPQPIHRLWSVGDRWRLIHSLDSAIANVPEMFDRNVRAFGPAIQAALSDLRIAIVGCGGTGSAVAEQLARLGVRNLLLIDPDILSASNVTRVYGSTAKDVGRPKVDALRDHLLAIAPALACEAVGSMITVESTARLLCGVDLVFGCTDDNAGRLVLSRAASYLLTPIIDVGVLLSSDSVGALSGIDARVTVLSPGYPCLVCRDRIDLARAAVEMRTPEERRRLEDEGYAPALGAVEPAVVAFTTAVAAAAVNELLERLIGYGPYPRPSEVLLRLHEREISTNRSEPRSGHYCDSASEKLGAGAASPFLEQAWIGS